jgi:hypothetical protein
LLRLRRPLLNITMFSSPQMQINKQRRSRLRPFDYQALSPSSTDSSAITIISLKVV